MPKKTDDILKSNEYSHISQFSEEDNFEVPVTYEGREAVREKRIDIISC